MTMSDILQLWAGILPFVTFIYTVLHLHHKSMLERFTTLEANLKQHVTDTMLTHIRTENHGG